MLDGQLQWRLISNLSLNYLSLQSVDPLKAVLTAYDFAALHDIQRARSTRKRLSAMSEAVTKPIDRLVHGLPVRGMKTVLRLDPSGFLCEGDMYLFGTVLSQFFSCTRASTPSTCSKSSTPAIRSATHGQCG